MTAPTKTASPKTAAPRRAPRKAPSRQGGLIVAVAIVVVFAGLIYTLHGLMSTSQVRKVTTIEQVTLLKPPPPPPPMKEKLPEPEQVKEMKQSMEVAGPINEPAGPKGPEPPDSRPAGNDLGVDAEGGAGSDAFGLVGRRGGRSFLAGGGGGGTGSPFQKYGWYTRLIVDQINKRLLKAGSPAGGRLQAVVKVALDEHGRIVKYTVCGSSGNPRMDRAVEAALGQIQTVGQPLPEGMPHVVKLRITSPG